MSIMPPWGILAAHPGFPAGSNAGSLAFSPQARRPSEEKLLPYECGVDTKAHLDPLRVNYFLYALVFLAFDIETIFLFPWAVKFQQLGLFAFVEMIIFIAILLIGLWYAWKEGALKWY